jgi:hypothetical protein
VLALVAHLRPSITLTYNDAESQATTASQLIVLFEL